MVYTIKLFLVTLTFLVTTFCASGADKDISLPPGMEKCPMKQPKRDECIARMLNKVFPQIKGGWKPMNLPPIDPFTADEFKTFNLKAGTASFKAKLSNVISKGLSSIEFKNARTKLEDDSFHMELDVVIPSIEIQADFKVKGEFNKVKMNQKGHANVVASDITATFVFDGNMVTKSGQIYVKSTKFDGKLKLKKLHFDIKGAFPDEDTNKLVNEFFNQTYELVLDDILKQAKSIWQPLAKSIFESIFDHVPLARLISSEIK